MGWKREQVKDEFRLACAYTLTCTRTCNEDAREDVGRTLHSVASSHLLPPTDRSLKLACEEMSGAQPQRKRDPTTESRMRVLAITRFVPVLVVVGFFFIVL